MLVREWIIRESMLDWIEVNIIDVIIQIVLIPDNVIPKPMLPHLPPRLSNLRPIQPREL